MKFRNNWKSPNKQWDKLIIKLRISSIDVFSIEIDKTRMFYCLTILNFTIKNR
jgi:hypothetical protein